MNASIALWRHAANEVRTHRVALRALDDVGQQVAEPNSHVRLGQEHMGQPVHAADDPAFVAIGATSVPKPPPLPLPLPPPPRLSSSFPPRLPLVVADTNESSTLTWSSAVIVRRPPGAMHVARLLSVNVGLPRDIEWHGRTVHTGIWKSPVDGRCRARRLNLEGDGQGDLAGHGGEHRAVFVYQIDSYRHWQERLGTERFRLRPVRRELHRGGTCRTMPCASATAIGSAVRCSKSRSLA